MINSNTYNLSTGKIRQNWAIGQMVNVGFLKGLKVIKIEAIKDGLPDIYTLQNTKGVLYEFVPNNGLTRIN